MTKEEIAKIINDIADDYAQTESELHRLKFRLHELISKAIADHEASQWKKYPENKPTDYEYYWVHHADGTEDKCICYHWDLFVESRKIIAFRELPVPYKGKEDGK